MPDKTNINKIKEKICLNCCNCESTYPLDSIGSLYCDIIDDYVLANDLCRAFNEQDQQK